MSDLRVNTISASDGTSPVALTKQSAAKAWINYEQAATFVTRDSLNISSVNDDGDGLADTNYASSFANANYAAAGSASKQAVAATTAYWTFPVRSTPVYTTNSTSWTSGYSIGTSSSLQALDCYLNIVNIHGDLA